MKIYIVWDNNDYGSTMSPSQEYIDSVYLFKTKADSRKESLNNGRANWRSRARVEGKELSK